MASQIGTDLARSCNLYRDAGPGAEQRWCYDQTLAAISARLVDSPDIESAIAATLQDIGEAIGAGSVSLWTHTLDRMSFTPIHTWSESMKMPALSAQDLAVQDVSRLLLRLQVQDHLEYSGQLPLELACLQGWFYDTLHIFPLYEVGELRGVLFCCDAFQLLHIPEESLRFMQVGCGLLGGMLRMHHMMATLEQRVAAQTTEVAAFFNMTVLAGTSLTMVDTLASALNMMGEIGHCDAMCAHVFSSETERLELVHHVGLAGVDHSQLLHIAAGSAFCQRIQQTKTPIFANEPCGFMREVYLPGFQCYLGAPMVVRGVVQGIISCFWRPARRVSINQVALLTALAEQLGVILENQRLYRNAQEMAVLHERQRMARELHDSVTQSLYCLTLFARAGREALEDNDTARLADCLTQVEGTARLSLTEMRLLLYELRPFVLENQGLVDALRTRLDLVERRLKIQVELQTPAALTLAHDVEEALYHVAIEALNNVLKHANAGCVTICLQLDGDWVDLLVCDDGIGFDVRYADKGMGLYNMRFRMAAVGGTMQIESHCNRGSQIRARVRTGLCSGQACEVDGSRRGEDTPWPD